MQLPITVDYLNYEQGDVFYSATNKKMILNSIDIMGNVYLKNEIGELKFRFDLSDFVLKIKNQNIRLFGTIPKPNDPTGCHHIYKFEKYFSNKVYITCSKCGFHKN